MTTPNRPLLSTAAQAVSRDLAQIMQELSKYCRVSISATDTLPITLETNDTSLEAGINALCAAALRACADQVVPEPPAWEIGVLASADREIEIRHEILAIAAELKGDKKAAEADPIAKATSSPETCNRRLDKFTSVTNDQLEVLAEIFSETDRADKISLHCYPVTRTVTIRYEDLDDGWFNDLCNLRSSLNP